MTDEIEATESAVELADEHGLDLSLVGGTGAGGRIIKADVESALEYMDAESALPAPSGDEHDERQERTPVPVQSINDVTRVVYSPVLGPEKMKFVNQGGPLTVLALSGGEHGKLHAAIRARDPEYDLTLEVQRLETAYVGPFAPAIYNRTDQRVWLDVAGEGHVAVLRVGV